MKKIILGAMLSLVGLSSTAYADSLCSNLPGEWKGTGVVVVEATPPGSYAKCIYQGSSYVIASDDKVNFFTSKVVMDLVHGICPLKVNLLMDGNCVLGHITMHAYDGGSHLSGQILPSGRTGTLAGDLSFGMNGEIYKGHIDHAIMKKSH